jgi:hypothetical protein
MLWKIAVSMPCSTAQAADDGGIVPADVLALARVARLTSLTVTTVELGTR